MRRDPIPTFRHAWSLLRRGVRGSYQALASRTLWRRLRTWAIVVVAFSLIGLGAARLSLPACERYLRQEIVAATAAAGSEIQLSDPQAPGSEQP